MKIFILLFFLIAFNISSHAQLIDSLPVNKKALYGSLKKYDFVESEYKGFQGMDKSVVWQTADSFYDKLPKKELMLCFDDSSYVLKYYAYLKLLPMDDCLAFTELKKMINDSTKILFWFNNSGGEQNFNQLLAKEYEKFIQLKYQRGGIVELPDQHYLENTTYRFSKAKKKYWKFKKEDFEKLMTTDGLSYEKIYTGW